MRSEFRNAIRTVINQERRDLFFYQIQLPSGLAWLSEYSARVLNLAAIDPPGYNKRVSSNLCRII
jgi:hypothetical protein